VSCIPIPPDAEIGSTRERALRRTTSSWRWRWNSDVIGGAVVVADPELARSLVAWGYGYTLANARPAPTRAVDGKRLQAVPVRGPVHTPQVGLARRAGLEPTRSAAAFAEVCAELLSARSG